MKKFFIPFPEGNDKKEDIGISCTEESNGFISKFTLRGKYGNQEFLEVIRSEIGVTIKINTDNYKEE